MAGASSTVIGNSTNATRTRQRRRLTHVTFIGKPTAPSDEKS